MSTNDVHFVKMILVIIINNCLLIVILTSTKGYFVQVLENL